MDKDGGTRFVETINRRLEAAMRIEKKKKKKKKIKRQKKIDATARMRRGCMRAIVRSLLDYWQIDM